MPDEDQAPQVEIVDFQQTRVAMLEHRGDEDSIGESVRRFIAWRKEVGLVPPASATFNLFYEGPNSGPDDFDIGLCAATDREVEPNSAGVVDAMIPGGRCAVLRHIGSERRLPESIHHLLAIWLPQSGESKRNFPFFCQRVHFGPGVPEHEWITDIFLPLR